MSSREVIQFAVFERTPQFSSAEYPLLFAPYRSAQEAEDARVKYGLTGENFYVARIAPDHRSPV
jgi:hypothetical protein